MAQQTAMQIMYDELIAHEYTIPISLIVKCKELIEMEKEQSKEKWEEIEDEYSRDEYPPFGGPFTNARTEWEWLKQNYYSPIRKNK